MVIDINILPRQTMTWEEFLRQTPPGSIGLDGIVKGGPNFYAPTYHHNFDHHDGVIRSVTMSTTREVLFAIKLGLIEDAPGDLHLYMNDTDQDVCTATSLFVNHMLIEGVNSNPELNRLIEIVDRLDVTGGAFPMDLSGELLGKYNWVFEPYTQARKTGVIATADENTMMVILLSVLERIRILLAGKAKQVPLDTRHEILYESPWGYKLIDEIGGNDARCLLFKQGLKAYVSLVHASPGRNVYSIGRRSQYVQFPVTQILRHLHSLEPGWGPISPIADEDPAVGQTISQAAEQIRAGIGSDIVGGSPRLTGSRFTPEQLAQIIDAFICSVYSSPV